MVELDEKAHYLGEGKTRRCYYHPTDDTKCIKIFFSKEHYDRIHAKEVRELKRLARKRLHNLVIPKYHGSVDTNLGKGYIFDLVADSDGASSITLKKYLEENLNEGAETMAELREILRINTPVIYGLNLNNFLILQREGESKTFAVIDGFGEGTLIPLRSMFKYFSWKKTAKAFTRLEGRAEKLINQKKEEERKLG